MQMHSNDIVITLDDDAIYHKETIEKLVQQHQQFPNCIISGRAHGIRLNTRGYPLPYQQWEWESKTYELPKMNLMPTGVGGVLYPPYCLDKTVFDKELIKQLCQWQDDVWLKTASILRKTKTVLAKMDTPKPRSIPGTENTGLYFHNKYNGGTDQSIQNVTRYFKLNWRELLNA